MSSSDDYAAEMPRNTPLDENSIAAILAGDAGAEPALAAWVCEMRSVGTGPVPQPCAALSNVFLHGVSTGKGDLPATAASNVTGPAPQAAGLPTWRKYKMAVKQFIAGLSIAGKLALGAGVAAAATTGAGTAGVLPDQVQHQFARAFDTIAPFEVKDPQPGSVLGPPEPSDAPSAAREAPESTTTVAAEPTTTKVPEPAHVESTTTQPKADDHGANSGGGAGEHGATTPSTTEVHHEPTTTKAPEHHEPTTTKAPEHHEPTTTKAPEVPTPVTLSISCAQNAAAVSVNCSWTVLTPTPTAQYKLLRSDGRVVADPRDTSTTSAVDVHSEGGHTYQYMIIALDATGKTIGHSAYVSVTVVAV